MSQPHELPAPAKIKLMRLRQDSDDALALLRADAASASAYGERIGTLLRRIESCDPKKEVAAIKAFEDEIAMMREEMQRLETQSAERRKRMATARQVVVQIEDVWLPRSRGLKLQVAAPVRVALQDGESILQAIDRVRREIVGLDAEQRQLRAAPISAEELKAAVRKTVAKLAGEGEPFIDARSPDKLIVQFPMKVAAPALLAWADPDRLVASLDAKIDAMTAGRGVPTAEKHQRLEGMAARMLHLERTEEALVEQAIAAGLTPARRSHASPLAILGLCVADSRAFSVAAE